MTAAPTDQRAAARRKRLALASAATLAATAWVAMQPDDAVTPRVAKASVMTPAPRPPRSAERTSPAATPNTPAPWPAAPTAATRSTWIAVSASGIAAWGPPAAPPTPPSSRNAPAAQAAPDPPPFPYTLIGRLDDGEPQALLSGPNRSFGVKAADVIDGQWRVDEVQPRALTLTWLPGGIKRTLAFAPS